MKQLFVLLCCLGALALEAQTGNAGLGTTTPDPSAKFDIVSDSQGFLMPRMSSAQRLAIANPASGLMVYDTDTGSHWFYNGLTWVNLVSPPVLIPSQTLFTSINTATLNLPTETVMGSHVIPAQTLGTDGQSIEVHVFGKLQSDTCTLKLLFGTEVMVFPVSAAGNFELRVRLYRGPSNTFKASGTIQMDTYHYVAGLNGTADFSLSMPFQILASQGQATNNGVIIEGFSLSRIR